MKILEVVGISRGGVGRHLRGLCEGLAASGNEVTVAYSPRGIDEAFQRFMAEHEDVIRFFPIEVQREISPVADLRAMWRLLRLIRRAGPFDIIHGHSAKGGTLARIAGRYFSIPALYTPHSLIMSSPELSRTKATVFTWLERILGRWATTKIIAVSEGEYDLILKLKLVPKHFVEIIENGIEDRDFERLSVRAAHMEPGVEDLLTFGSTMRFSPQKAPGHLIEAFVEINGMLPQVPTRLIVAGDGELFADAKDLVAAHRMNDKIILLGWREDVRDVLSRCDVFVLPSLYEGFSYSLLEAMAAGLPIVTTDVFGVKETVSRVPGNVVVSAEDPGALAEGMRRMATYADSRSLHQSLRAVGQANHDYARSHFSQSEVTRRTLRLYQSLV